MAISEVKSSRPILGHDDFVNAQRDLEGSLRDLTVPDEEWMSYNVPQIRKVRELIIDDSELSAGADVVVRMMSEFAAEGSEFQPSVDDDLIKFIVDTVQREVPNIRPNEVIEILENIDDFPPVTRRDLVRHPRTQYDLTA